MTPPKKSSILTRYAFESTKIEIMKSEVTKKKSKFFHIFGLKYTKPNYYVFAAL